MVFKSANRYGFIVVANSPSIGLASKTFAQVVIDANDNANGVLQLSAALLTVSEGVTTPILHVLRSAGVFGEVCKSRACHYTE